MIKKIKLKLLITLLSQLMFLTSYAVKAYPFPITITQPDGTLVTTLLHGDEFHHFQTSDDGYVLKLNAKGFLTYAIFNSTGDVVESGFTAHNTSKRSLTEMQFLKTINQPALIHKAQNIPLKSKAFKAPVVRQKSFPLNGSPKSLVILVNFSDNSFVTPDPQTAFGNLLNQDNYSTNGGTGSARDYFMASTYGKFSPEFDVVGPVTLPQTLDYYGKNDAGGNDINPVQMVIDACSEANKTGVDFTQYDMDNDGVIDNVFIYYAGYNEAEGGPANTIWPHRWGVYPFSLFPSSYNYAGAIESVTFNGKRLMDYACTSELRGTSGSKMCGVGTFCHEFGHVLGLPDYYDTSGTQSHTLDSWDIMDYGNYNNLGRTPPAYSVYDRFFLGYLIPEQVNSTSKLTLLPIYQGKTSPANTTNQAFLFSQFPSNLVGNSPLPNEFFLLEYRQKTGWDTFIPAEGLCIWHIDYDQNAWDNNVPNNYSGTSQTFASHMRVYLVPPSGVGTTPPNSAFTSGSFIPALWDGTDINRRLNNITMTTNNITVNLMSPILSTNGSFTDFTTTLGTPSEMQSINITAGNINGILNLNLQSNSNFELKLSTDIAWSKSLSIVPTAGNINAVIQVRYDPMTTSLQTDHLVISSPGLTTSTFGLTGTATIGPNSPVIYVGKIDTNLTFLATKINDCNIKSINIQTTDLVGDLNLNLSGTNATMFMVSINTITKDAANGIGGFVITISYTPTTAGNHSATLTIDGGGLIPAKVITLSGTGL